MNAAKWWNDSTKKWTRRLAMPVLALALAASLVTFNSPSQPRPAPRMQPPRLRLLTPTASAP